MKKEYFHPNTMCIKIKVTMGGFYFLWKEILKKSSNFKLN